MEHSQYEIGLNTDWKIIKNTTLLYVEHEFLGRIDGEELISPPVPLPYAYINVESPDLPDLVTIPVGHKIDFYNLWLLHDKLFLEGAFDVVIRRRQASGMKSLFKSILPTLEYLIYPLGHFDDLHDPQRCAEAELKQPLVYLYDQERISYVKES